MNIVNVTNITNITNVINDLNKKELKIIRGNNVISTQIQGVMYFIFISQGLAYRFERICPGADKSVKTKVKFPTYKKMLSSIDFDLAVQTASAQSHEDKCSEFFDSIPENKKPQINLSPVMKAFELQKRSTHEYKPSNTVKNILKRLLL